MKLTVNEDAYQFKTLSEFKSSIPSVQSGRTKK